MDIQNVKALADLAFDRNVHKQNLKERIQPKLMVASNGGLFKATPELYTFLKLWDEDEVYLEDVYGNPIKVDREELLHEVLTAYHFAMNTWYTEYELLKKVRKSEDV